MFPLCSPSHSGVGADLAALAIVVATLAACVAGLGDLWARGRTRAGGAGLPRVDAVTLAAYASLVMVGCCVAVMLAGGRPIRVAQGIFLAFTAWGVVIAARAVPRAARWLRGAPASELGKGALLAGAAAASVWFWATIFGDHVGLPVAHDGIAHTAFYLRILEFGVPTLGRVPIGFADVFGTQTIEFYPTGTHTLVAIASGFWGQWGVISHAGILKAWFTLAMAAAPWSAWWIARRLMPRMPWWVGLALLFVAVPGFRYPTEAAHEGGASRIFAHVLLAPIYADVVLGRFLTWSVAPGPWSLVRTFSASRRIAVAGLLLAVAFLMHPTAFVTLAALLGYAAIHAAVSPSAVRPGLLAPAAAITAAAATASPRQRSRALIASEGDKPGTDERHWRERIGVLVSASLAVAIAGAISMWLVRWNNSEVLPRLVQPFSLAALWSRLLLGAHTLFDPDYGMAPVKLVLVAAGGFVLLLRREALGISRRAVGFAGCLALVAGVAVTARVVPLPGFAQIGGAYYDEPARSVEVVYEAVAFCLVAIAWAAWRVASAWRRAAGPVVAVAIVLLAIVHQQFAVTWVDGHVRYWDRKFATPRISRLRDMGAWIERHAEPDAIVFHEPFDSEVWEAWTGRRGSFMYGECYRYGHDEQHSTCLARRDLVSGRIGVLRRLLDEPAPFTRCLTAIDRFRRPGYFLVATPVASSAEAAVCSDATYVATLDGHAIFRYRKPEAVSSQ